MVYFWKICSLNLLFIHLKELILQKESVKMDEYYSMFITPSCYGRTMIHYEEKSNDPAQ